MHDLVHRFALGLLFLCGLGTALAGVAAAGIDQPLVWHRQFMVVLVGAALLLAVWRPALRLPAIAAALLVKAGALAIGWASGVPLGVAPGAEIVGLTALALAGAVFLHEARMEARWDGVLAFRPEVR
jgi:hypothetical protein